MRTTITCAAGIAWARRALAPLARPAARTLLATGLAAVSAAASPDAPQAGLMVGEVDSTFWVTHRGDAEADRRRENRRLGHSVLEFAGRYVQIGERLTITLAADAQSVYLAIGAYGSHASLGIDRRAGIGRTVLQAGVNHVVSDRSGLVWLVNTGGGSVRAHVAGGLPVPTFTLGQTREIDFGQQLVRFAESPFAVLQSEHVVAALQRSTVANHLPHVTEQRIRSWDRVVALTDAAYGLSRQAKGLHRRSAGRIHIANPDDGHGYAFATHGYVSFHNSTGAGADLLRKPVEDQWGLWHEIGHTYQAPQLLWEGMSEVTVNLSSLVVQASVGGVHPLKFRSREQVVRNYLSNPVRPGDYDAQTDPFLKLAMFVEMYAVLGEHFFPELHTRYREAAACGKRLVTDDSKRQFFMQTAAEVAGRDLTPVFVRWGLSLSPLTRRALATHPAH